MSHLGHTVAVGGRGLLHYPGLPADFLLDGDALLAVHGVALLGVLHLVHHGALLLASRLQDHLALLVKHLPAVPREAWTSHVGAGGLVTLLRGDHVVTKL